MLDDKPATYPIMTSLETTQLIRQGIAAMQGRDASVAAECFARVLEQEPGNVEALHAMANLNHAQGDFDGAESLLEKIIELQPDNAAAQNNLGIYPSAYPIPRVASLAGPGVRYVAP